MSDKSIAALAQIAPVLLDREATLAKVEARVREAGANEASLVVFGEALVPGYPVWVERTGGARFDDATQKALFARYSDQAVRIDRGHLDGVRAAAREARVNVVLGAIERPAERGGHSLYCSLVFVSDRGSIESVHRKLVPTYEERLVWSPGDGHGLRVHRMGEFTVGALNCWENWMPLTRAAMYAQGEDVHVAVWPGNERNTRALTPVIAREARAYALSVSGLLRGEDVPADVPARERIAPEPGELILDGGSCAAGPDGRWLTEPVVGREELILVELDPERVREERQNFDPNGHYSRPDVLQLHVDRRRQAVAEWRDGESRESPNAPGS